MRYRYDDPRARTAKSLVYRAFLESGVDKARVVARKCNIKPTSLNTWLSQFRKQHSKPTRSRRLQANRGPNAQSGLRIMQLAYRRGGLMMAKNVGAVIKLRPTTIHQYAKLIEGASG
jgi:transposase-like protein